MVEDGDGERAVGIGSVKSWQCTGEVRWFDRTEGHPTYGPLVAHRVRVLQQRWYCATDGRDEWRDVPTVEG